MRVWVLENGVRLELGLLFDHTLNLLLQFSRKKCSQLGFA